MGYRSRETDPGQEQIEDLPPSAFHIGTCRCANGTCIFYVTNLPENIVMLHWPIKGNECIPFCLKSRSSIRCLPFVKDTVKPWKMVIVPEEDEVACLQGRGRDLTNGYDISILKKRRHAPPRHSHAEVGASAQYVFKECSYFRVGCLSGGASWIGSFLSKLKQTLPGHLPPRCLA